MNKLIKLSVLIFFLFINLKPLRAQDFNDIRTSPEKYTLKEVEEKFNEYQKNQLVLNNANRVSEAEEQEGESGEFLLKRWLSFYKYRMDKSGKAANWNGIAAAEYEKLKDATGYKMPGVFQGNWQPIGPTDYVVTAKSAHSGIGRINCIAFHPTVANTYWIGTPSGGCWKTSNNGTTWTCLTDDKPNLGVSGICIKPSDPNTIYILTGDGDGGNTYCQGVYRTTTGGAPWTLTGLSFPLTTTVRGYKLVMHPTNNNILFAITSSGIHKTTNGGTTWTLVKSGNFCDIEFKPTAPATIYACTATEIFKSTQSGNINTWVQLTAGLPANPPSDRIALAVSPAKPGYIYAAFCQPEGALVANPFIGLYRSTNSGSTFSLRASTPNVMGRAGNGSDNVSQSTYDFVLTVSPTNASEIYIGGINIWKSTTGGTNLKLASFWEYDLPGQPFFLHADQHALEFNTLSNELYSGNDGGISQLDITTKKWTFKGRGLQISQAYNIDPRKQYEGYYAALQDNGANYLPEGDLKMQSYSTGDGIEIIERGDSVFTLLQEGLLGRYNKHPIPGTGLTQIIINPDIIGAPFIQSFAVHPTNAKVIYRADQAIYKSTDGGGVWQQKFTDNNDINKIEINEGTPNIIVACTNSEIYKSIDAGATWSHISTSLPAIAAPIAGIHADGKVSLNGNKIWAYCGEYDAGNKVFETTDGGTIWSNITGSLSNLPVNCMANIQGSPVNALFAGTDIGVFYRDDNNPNWIPFNIGMPPVIIKDMEIDPVNDKITIATFGRGLWQSDLDCGNLPLDVSIISQAGNVICTGSETLVLNAKATCAKEYLWSDGATTKLVNVNSSGTYIVTVTDAGGATKSNSITICDNGNACLLWKKNLGGNGTDEGKGMAKTLDNGIIITGNTTSTNIPGIDNTAKGAIDIYAAKLNTNGDLLWQRVLGGSNNETAGGVANANDSGFVFCGSTLSNDGNVSGLHSTGFTDFWTFKLDKTGSLVWQKCLGGNVTDEGKCIIKGINNTFYVGGQTNSASNGDVLKVGGSSNTSKDYWITRIDGNSGAITDPTHWKNTHGGTLNDIATGLTLMSNGGVAVNGSTLSTDIDVVGNHGNPARTDFWFLELDSNNTIIRKVCLGGSSFDEGNAITKSLEGGYYFGGEASSDDFDLGSPNIHNSPGADDLTVIKTTATGSTLWGRTFGGTALDKAFSLVTATDSGVVVCGFTGSQNNGNVIGNHGDNDIWVVKIDKNGNLQWQRSIGGSLADNGTSIIQTNDGNFVICGTVNSTDGDVTSSLGGADIFAAKIAAFGCAKPFTGFQSLNITTVSATLKWDIRSCPTSYNVFYRPVGTQTFLTALVPTNTGSVAIAGLIAGTNYEWQVQSLCAGNFSSELSPLQTFKTKTTPRIAFENETEDGFKAKVFPNPNDGSFTLALKSDADGDAVLNVLDVMGKSLTQKSIAISEGETQIDFNLSNFSKGVYFIKITLGEKSKVERLVIY